MWDPHYVLQASHGPHQQHAAAASLAATGKHSVVLQVSLLHASRKQPLPIRDLQPAGVGVCGRTEMRGTLVPSLNYVVA